MAYGSELYDFSGPILDFLSSPSHPYVAYFGAFKLPPEGAVQILQRRPNALKLP
jgi:hypothetical protein